MKKLFTPQAMAFLMAIFINAFIDIGHKIVIQNTLFKVYDGSTLVILTAVVNALILLPFILLLSPAGFVADRFAKHKVLRMSAKFALLFTFIITLAYTLGWFWLAFAMTLLLAIQSAFYSPAKYAYLKNFFGHERLAQANGLVQATSIIAILVGIFSFSLLFEWLLPAKASQPNEILPAMTALGVILMINSFIELLMVYRLPNTDAEQQQVPNFSLKRYLSGRLLCEHLICAWHHHTIWLSMVGLALFWSVGQVLLAVFPPFAKTFLAQDNTVIVQGLLAMMGIGIALGALFAARVSKRHIETGLIPIGALGIATCLYLLPSLESLWAHGLNFLCIGMMGGLFMVPLNALIQYHAPQQRLGSILSTNNFIQNTSMLLFLITTVVLSIQGFSSKQLLHILTICALCGGIYTVYRLPQSLVRLLLALLMRSHYKVHVQGMRHIPRTGGVLLLGNHISFVDWAVIQLACPRPVHFVMERQIYERWYLRRFLKALGCIPISAGISSKQSLQAMADLLSEGKVVCLFPEGTLSRTGHLTAFRKGYEKAAMMAVASEENPINIVPFYTQGLWGSRLSRSSSYTKWLHAARWRREVIVAFGERLAQHTPASTLKHRVFDLSVTAWQAYAQSHDSLAHEWVNTVKRRHLKQALIDTQSGELSSSRALAVAAAFARRLRPTHGKHLGLLVPTSMAGMLANMAGLMAGKTLVNLNYTASIDALLSALEQAEIQTLLTSKRFIKKLADRGVDVTPLLARCQVLYLEEVREEIATAEILARQALVHLLPAACLSRLWVAPANIQQTAVILFSSGSEGAPKGVQLSHDQLTANVKQMSEVINANDDDKVMASLPLFHAFGLTVTQFMPLLQGLPVVCHPDPTDVLNIAKAIAKYRATFMFATSTFLRLYCRNTKIHPLMLSSLRLIVAGAEKLNPDVRQQFTLKFSKQIYEGYGATETAPVASTNLPDVMDFRHQKVHQGQRLGSVGMPLPGTSFRIVDPSTLEELPQGEEGMILISGAQLMQGYLKKPEKTAQVIREIDNMRWYVSGDKGKVDEQGFLTIVDRYSRFAKVGGEMISLAEVEAQVLQTKLCTKDQEQGIVAVNIPDDKKGESIILLTTANYTQQSLREALLANACAPLLIPTKVIKVATLPLLGSGKTDVVSAKKIALGACA